MDRLQRSMIDRKGSRFSTDEPTMARPTWRRSSSTTFFSSNRGRPLLTTDATQQETLEIVQLPLPTMEAIQKWRSLASRSVLHDQGIEVSGTPTIRPSSQQWDSGGPRRRPSSQRWDSRKTRPKTLKAKTLRRLSFVRRPCPTRERSFALSYTRTLFCVDFFSKPSFPLPQETTSS